ALARILPAADEHVEQLVSAYERRELARGRDEHPRPARGGKRGDVTADEVHGVAAQELLPGQRRVLARRHVLAPEHGDRALADLVDIRERTPLRLTGARRMQGDAARLD